MRYASVHTKKSKRSETHTLRHLQASQRAALVRFVLCQLMVSVVEEISFDVCIEIGADRTFVGRVFDSCSIETLVGHTERRVEDHSAVSAFQRELIVVAVFCWLAGYRLLARRPRLAETQSNPETTRP